jgi:hypothetical protein
MNKPPVRCSPPHVSGLLARASCCVAGLAFALPAAGGVPVVFDGGEAPTVVEAVAARTGLPADQLDAIALSELMQRAPEAVGGAVMRRCTRSPSQVALANAELARAEAAWVKGDAALAMDHLDMAVAMLGCLSELVDARTAAKVFLLRGALQAVDAPDVASGEVRTALALNPDLEWDDRYPENGLPVLVAQRKVEPSIELAPAPAVSAAGPWLDGVKLAEPREVAEGLHLAQYSGPGGIQSAWLVVASPATLVVPTSYRRPVLETLVDAAAHPEVAALLAAAVPEFEVGYASWNDGLWLVSAEESGLVTTEIAPPTPPPPPEEPGKKGKKGKKGE